MARDHTTTRAKSNMGATRRQFLETAGGITRLLTIAICFTAAVAVGDAAKAEETTWRFASVTPIDSPEGKVFTRFAELTEKYSDGTLKIQIYPNEQLGKVDAVLEQLQRGTVQIFAEGSIFMRKWVSDLNWTAASFLLDDRDHWHRFMNSDLVKGWYQKVADEVGIMVLGDPTAVLRGPYRVIVSNRQVDNYDDIQGLKLRMYPSETALATWTHLGTEVRTLAWTDVYQSIDKGIVEAVTSPIALVESMRFYEVAPHLARLDEYYQSIAFMMNVEAYEALTDEQRAALEKAYTETGVYSQEVIGSVADDSIGRMKAKGVTFVNMDPAPFVESMKTFYAKLQSEGGLPEGFLETVEATRQK